MTTRSYSQHRKKSPNIAEQRLLQNDCSYIMQRKTEPLLRRSNTL